MDNPFVIIHEAHNPSKYNVPCDHKASFIDCCIIIVIILLIFYVVVDISNSRPENYAAVGWCPTKTCPKYTDSVVINPFIYPMDATLNPDSLRTGQSALNDTGIVDSVDLVNIGSGDASDMKSQNVPDHDIATS